MRERKAWYGDMLAGWGMFWQSVSMSFSNIAHNRMRSFLTMLGIMIGVTAVIALVTTVSGVSASLSDSFSSMGAGSLTVSVTGSDLKSGLTTADMEQIGALEHVDGVIPSVSLSARVSKGAAYETGVSLSGVNEYYFVYHEDVVTRGRQFNYMDIRDMNYVCLINAEMVETFFYGVNPVGEKLIIDGLEFLVVGLFDDSDSTSISSMLGESPGILLPYTTALKLNSENVVNSIVVYIDGTEHSEAVQASLESTLDAMFSYEEDTYAITDMESLQETMDSMLSMMSALLGSIASIALVVGGIGIMNMMLTSVTERTMEIGLKKALGAQPGQIQMQFLIESFLLSMTGGLAGVVLGNILSMILCSVMGTTFVISYGAIGLGFGFSAAVGILFGWAPARKASRLNPIDALRRI